MKNPTIDKVWETFCKAKNISFNKKITEIKRNPGYCTLDDEAEWHAYLTDIIGEFCEYNKSPISRELIQMIVCICDAHFHKEDGN